MLLPSLNYLVTPWLAFFLPYYLMRSIDCSISPAVTHTLIYLLLPSPNLPLVLSLIAVLFPFSSLSRALTRSLALLLTHTLICFLSSCLSLALLLSLFFTHSLAGTAVVSFNRMCLQPSCVSLFIVILFYINIEIGTIEVK